MQTAAVITKSANDVSRICGRGTSRQRPRKNGRDRRGPSKGSCLRCTPRERACGQCGLKDGSNETLSPPPKHGGGLPRIWFLVRSLFSSEESDLLLSPCSSQPSAHLHPRSAVPEQAGQDNISVSIPEYRELNYCRTWLM